jgi:hypothetical protein
MAHYAYLDEHNVVTQIIVGCNEEEGTDWETEYGEFAGQICKRTSYNTRFGKHFDSETGEESGDPFRKNYACIGFTFDSERDAFIPPKPFPSFILNEDTCQWESPVPRPDNEDIDYIWDEDTTSWVISI